jgi:hypothetical protein
MIATVEVDVANFVARNTITVGLALKFTLLATLRYVISNETCAIQRPKMWFDSGFIYDERALMGFIYINSEFHEIFV